MNSQIVKKYKFKENVWPFKISNVKNCFNLFVLLINLSNVNMMELIRFFQVTSLPSNIYFIS